MKPDDTAAARFAMWWAETVTRTAAPSVALDRRAEIASDVHDQLAEARERGALSAGSRAVAGRVVRGMPADLIWRTGLELQPSRRAWHLRNPSTAITALFVVMLPLNLVADSAWPGRSSLVDYRWALWALTNVVGLCILLLALTAAACRIWPSLMAGAEPFEPRSRLERGRRCATAGLGIALAGSALLRFGALGPVGGAFWFAFWVCALAYVALLLATAVAKVIFDFRKIPS